ncbi:MAG: hypothetical protein GX081_04660 [Firmicutes bacterium]|nr:hypothetical protein [Bacillota bacterium]
MIRDRYIMGLISGFCGGLVGAAINLVADLIFKTRILRYIDFSGVFVFGHFPRGIGETIFSILTFFGFAATLGVVFIYFVSLSKPYLLLKAIHFALGIWFISYAITILFKVPELAYVTLAASFSNLLAAVAYGLVMGLVLLRLLRGGSPSRSE